MKGFIVVTAEYFYSLLTLHSLDSNFENRLLLSQQPFHHRAKLPWRKKLKHNQTPSLDATILNVMLNSEELFVYWLHRVQGYEVISSYAVRLDPGSKHVSVRQKWLEISGKHALVLLQINPNYELQYVPTLCLQMIFSPCCLSGTPCTYTVHINSRLSQK